MATPIIPQWVPNNFTIIPAALSYLDGNGYPVTQLYPLDYLVLVGQDLAILSGTTNQLLAAWAYQANQISVIQSEVATIPPVYHTPTINPQCLALSGSTAIDVVLELLCQNWCTFLTATGSASALSLAVAEQCQNLNSSPSFGVPGTSMSAISGWKNSPVTVADTINNQWLTLCDARAGIQNALNAVTPTCSQVIVDYRAILTSSNTVFNLYFDSYTFVPVGFTDNGSQIQITDAVGNTYIQTFNLVNASLNPAPLQVYLSGTTLQFNSTYTFTLTSNVRNTTLGLTCQKTTIKTIYATPQNVSACCPDIGNYSANISGSTAITLMTTLTYTPRFVQILPKDLTSGALSQYKWWLTYSPGGAILNLNTSWTYATINLDWIAFK